MSQSNGQKGLHMGFGGKLDLILPEESRQKQEDHLPVPDLAIQLTMDYVLPPLKWILVKITHLLEWLYQFLSQFRSQ